MIMKYSQKKVNMSIYRIIFLLFMTPHIVFAENLNDAGLCTEHFNFYELNHQLPSKLLKSISLAETGRWDSSLSKYVPWPWSINANGKSYVFSTKAEAIRKAKSLQEKGVSSIDIGCMQINLQYHPNAFASIDQGFDPQHNIQYAAFFLKDLYKRHGNWENAIAHYHSSNPIAQSRYLSRVLMHWHSPTYAKGKNSYIFIKEKNQTKKKSSLIAITKKALEYKAKNF